MSPKPHSAVFMEKKAKIAIYCFTKYNRLNNYFFGFLAQLPWKKTAGTCHVKKK